MNRLDIVNMSTHPASEVERLVRFALGDMRVGHVAVNVKGSGRAYGGRAYSRVPTVSTRAAWRRNRPERRRLVVLRVGPASRFPVTGCAYPGLKTAPVFDLRDWREALVYLAAHELRHCMQWETNSPGSEIDAETTAVRMLERYRATLAPAAPQTLDEKDGTHD